MGLREMIHMFLSRLGKGVGLPELPPLPDHPKVKIDERRAREIEARLNRLELQQRLAEGRYRDAPGRNDE